MTFFGQREDEQTRKLWLRRVQRLATYGVLHQDLIPFLWPGGTLGLSTVFWKWARSQEEGELWSRDVASSEEDAIAKAEGLHGDSVHLVQDEEAFGTQPQHALLPPHCLRSQLVLSRQLFQDLHDAFLQRGTGG